jgi:hypothetical protein
VIISGQKHARPAPPSICMSACIHAACCCQMQPEPHHPRSSGCGLSPVALLNVPLTLLLTSAGKNWGLMTQSAKISRAAGTPVCMHGINTKPQLSRCRRPQATPATQKVSLTLA